MTDVFAALTSHEKHVLLQIEEGKTNGEIAHALGYAHGTIRNHVSVILQKLGCDNRAALASYATANGLRTSRFWEPPRPLPVVAYYDPELL